MPCNVDKLNSELSGLSNEFAADHLICTTDIMESSAEEEETVQREQTRDERIDVMAWKIDETEKEILCQEDPEVVVNRLLQSVSEVKNDYQNLRRELVEVQALQRELSGRLRQQLRQVHGTMINRWRNAHYSCNNFKYTIVNDDINVGFGKLCVRYVTGSGGEAKQRFEFFALLHNKL